MKIRSLLSLVAVFAVSPAATDAEVLRELSTAEEIEACVQGNLPNESSVLTVAFRSHDRIGAQTETRGTIYWKKSPDGLSNLMMRFHQPPDMRGAGLLLLEKQGRRPDTLMYLPELRKVRRVSSRAVAGSMFGTDFSYEDFERLMGMASDASSERLEDAEVEGESVYVVEGRPSADAASAYQRVVSFVDKEHCVPLRSESYERGGDLRKLLTVDAKQITLEGDSWVPRLQVMKDLRDDTRTELVIENVELDRKIPRKMFSARELEAGAR